MDTIHALSSGGVPCGVAVVRVSGPACRGLLEATIGVLPVARRAALRSIRDRNGEVVDRGLVLWLPGPESFTGEDMIEFQVHGSRAVVRALARHLDGFAGVRPAEPGEFTRRAFLAGRVDLTEAEGLADLLAAETEAQRRQAAAQASGTLRRLYGEWRTRLIRIRALVEADFDFADEEDVPGSVADAAWVEAERLAEEIRRHLGEAERGERTRSGLQVVLLGRPNAGKSSLLNALAQRDVAIVTEEAGTTRDLIEVHLDLGGWPVTIVDTAGLREDAGRVEAEGMRRALARSETADLVLWLSPVDQPEAQRPDGIDAPIWEVWTKADLAEVSGKGARFDSERRVHEVSAVDGHGLGGLLTALEAEARDRCGSGTSAVPSRERHRVHLERVMEALESALRAGSLAPELRAEDLRRAGDELGRITGEIGVEDLLDVIFGEFCIGK